MGPRRPQVLLALRPALLADLFRRSLTAELDVVVAPPLDRRRTFDVAVVSPSAALRGLRAQFLLVVPAPPTQGPGGGPPVAEDFESTVGTIRRLAAAAVAHPGP